MKSVIDVEVSCFPNYKEPNGPKSVNLLTWLKSAQYREQVEDIRAITDKVKRNQKKAALPAITPSGVFTRRHAKALIQHSGLICLDIDYKGNEHIGNFGQLKQQICHIKNVAYCGLSVSGNGYFVLIPIAYPHLHDKQFKALSERFKKRFGIRIDDTPDVCRLRGYSYDESGYFNHTAEVYRGVYSPPPLKPNRPVSPAYGSPSIETTQDKVENVINQVRLRRIDVTGDYRQWIKIGCAFANEFGEGGRNYFHEVSQFYLGYQPQETDRQFDELLKHQYPYTIGTFFKYCADAGLRPADESVIWQGDYRQN